MQTTQVNIRPGLIDFGIGQPGLSILPTEIIEAAAAHCLGQRNPDQLNYGAEQGDELFRQSLAEFLTRRYTFQVDRRELFVTTGNSAAIDMVCAMFTRPGDTVFIEEPTYFLALRIFQVDYALNVVPIPVDENGLDVDFLEDKLKEHRPKFIYTIPSYHNPTSKTLTQPRREQLHQLAQQHDFLIVADEVYQLLGYDSANHPPPAMAQFTADERVISLGSFSKILAPGLRLGWVQTSPALIKRFVTFGHIASGGSANHLTSGIVNSALQLGFQERYLDDIKKIYRDRIYCMDAHLRQNLPQTIRWEKPEGGFFFWLQLPEGVSATEIAKAAGRFDIGFVPGPSCSNINQLDNYFRLSFAFYNQAEIVEGCHRLGKLFDL